MNKSWLQFASYAALLVISLVLQTLRPDMFAVLCNPLPIDNLLNRQDRIDLPLIESPVPPTTRIK